MSLVIECPSPNFDARPPGQAVDILLLHYTGMASAAAALARMCDESAKVSAHYCIDEDGLLTRLVPEDKRAWHAGVASWAGADDINARSIGIELVNPGHEFGYRPFPEAQMARLIELAQDIPGELFDWARLAAAGIGLWPGDAPALAPGEPSEIERQLAAFGYGYLEQDFPAVVAAFQRHFRPAALTGEVDAESAGRLRALVALVDEGPSTT